MRHAIYVELEGDFFEAGKRTLNELRLLVYQEGSPVKFLAEGEPERVQAEMSAKLMRPT